MYGYGKKKATAKKKTTAKKKKPVAKKKSTNKSKRKPGDKLVTGTADDRVTYAKMKNLEDLGMLEPSKSDYRRIQKAKKLNKPARSPRRITSRVAKKRSKR